ncbi:MAG: nucleic acid-binding protein [Verrucomicrobiales bacterium]|nr:nucleic acid-binding protein [Verrucomicrobiales bacterium]
MQRNSRTSPFFERSSKRKRGFPSETAVKRGVRIVHGTKLLTEKLGRNDLCPCNSGRRFKKCCLKFGRYDGSPRDDYF